MSSTWYQDAVIALDAAIEKIPPGADKAEIVKAVRAAYPFGMRKFWPYKKWCEAQRKLLHLHWPKMFPAPKVKPRKSKKQTPDLLPGERTLFVVVAAIDAA